MDSFHHHLDELERLLSDDDKEKGRMKSRALCFAAFVGSNPVVKTLIHKGVGKKYKWPTTRNTTSHIGRDRQYNNNM